MPESLDHLRVTGFTESHLFKSTLSVRKGAAPSRDRVSHGRRLLSQLAQLTRDAEELEQQRQAAKMSPHLGMTIVLEVSPRGLLDYQKLEWRRDGIEVLIVTPAGTSDTVVLHVPEGKLSAFEKRIHAYLDKNTAKGKPAHAALINVIENFRKAAFRELWTEEAEPPAAGVAEWFQVWLRQTASAAETVANFVQGATPLSIEIENGFVTFPGRVVVAAYATRAALENAISLLDMVAEIRAVAPTAEFFLADLTPADQADWVRDLVARIHAAGSKDVPYVTLLDTGVNRGHPLIENFLSQNDMHVVDSLWPAADHHGHGTEMAGLSLHGNLTHPFAATGQHVVPHRLESVKILPPHGSNSPHLYGTIMSKAVALVETADMARRRTFATMTTAEGQSTGLPTEWSATIDSLAFGITGDISAPSVTPRDDSEASERRRLFVLSGGNVCWTKWADYPNVNDLTAIESPGQAWNALTVGAYTLLVNVDQSKYPTYVPIASLGGMAPASSTSMTWSRAWPFKPDVVAEGGNGCLDTGTQVVVGPESLRVLTTAHEMARNQLAESGGTSASAAEVARLCAQLSARYPDFWPETIRALVVHGAHYTDAMRQVLPLVPRKPDKEKLLRRYGFGAVNHERSLSSLVTRPNLILQETATPYRSEGSNVVLNAMNLHALPWPADVLRNLGDASVSLRVTLSYFIEPNPGRRGWQSKFRYQSHGFRFAVKAATESASRFNQRINKLEREKLDGEGDPHMPDPDVDNWFLGSQLRSRGSIHSDVWMGTAVDLAEKSHIAVFPVGGWWKDWKEEQRFAITVRYALVVSLEAANLVDIDLYTPVAAQIHVPVAVTVAR